MTIKYSAKFGKDTSDKDSLNASIELHERMTDNDAEVADFLAVVKFHRKRAGKEDDGTPTAAMQLVHVEALDGVDAEGAQRVLDRRYRKRMGRANVEDQTLTGWGDLFGDGPDEGALLLAEREAERHEADLAGALDVEAGLTEVLEAEIVEAAAADAERAADAIGETVDDAAADREERAATADVGRRLHAVPDAGFSHPEPEWDMEADLRTTSTP